MRYEIKFSCGHTATVDLFGPTKDRKRKIAWYEESGECPECYARRMEAQKAAGCTAQTMHYGEYKTNWFWCATANGSYDAKEKTITVYIPEAYSGLEDLIGTMAKNSHEKGRKEAYETNAYVIKSALDEKRITSDQVKILVGIAQKIREY